jgi:hypothetical protein
MLAKSPLRTIPERSNIKMGEVKEFSLENLPTLADKERLGGVYFRTADNNIYGIFKGRDASAETFQLSQGGSVVPLSNRPQISTPSYSFCLNNPATGQLTFMDRNDITKTLKIGEPFRLSNGAATSGVIEIFVQNNKMYAPHLEPSLVRQYYSRDNQIDLESATHRSIGGNAFEKVFDGAYRQIRSPRYGLSEEVHKRQYVEKLKDGIKEHILNPLGKGITLKEAFSDFRAVLDAKLSKQKPENYEAAKKVVDTLFKKFTGHINRLLENGQVDIKAALIFMKELPRLSDIGSYSAMVHNHAIVEDSRYFHDKAAYEKFAAELGKGLTNKEEQGGWFHFNLNYPSEGIKNRVYIGAAPGASQAEVIKAWQQALKNTGLQNDLYYKIPVMQEARQETIVIYEHMNQSASLEKALKEFTRICPVHLLSKEMPTTLTLKPGVFYAPEPANINSTLNFYENGYKRKLSYNQLIGALMQLSHELGYYDVKMSGQMAKGSSIEAKTKKYFEQMLRLSGINPSTMVPFNQGGELPKWASELTKS